ncbi:RTA1 like protein [Purpureocillium lavendulum]|uniref:RTA1 like protein n=1 Tax=Purpureocillium lavendulum TaxID=1247861 RepID=A0AB34FSN9_9HYPO|nr:RTA1 like protein [Purpureocillium lavendulum]
MAALLPIVVGSIMAELKPFRGNYYLWEYVPSKAAAILFTILFLIATVFVIWRMVRTKTLFSIAFTIGGRNAVVEVIGYAARAVSEDKTDQLGPFIVQSVLLLVAPALFAASIYMVLGRLMRSIHGERHSIIPVRWLTRAFVAGDIFSFLVQSSGAGLMANSSFSQKTAQNIILAGLLIQIVMFGLFAATAVIFDVRMRRWPSGASAEGGSGARWKQVLWMLYAVSALIMVRSVFRVIEYAMGKDGYLLGHEWTLYIFDAVLMLAVMALYGWIYPGELSQAAVKPRPWESVDSTSVGMADDVRYGGGGDGMRGVEAGK